MTNLRQMVHTALRDDSSLRTLVGNTTTTPYNVYREDPPVPFDFTSQAMVVWHFLANTPTLPSSHGVSMRQREQVFAVTAYSADPDAVDNILARVRRIFEDLKAVTLPSAGAEVVACHFEDEGPDLFDAEKKVKYRAVQFRIHYREDFTS